VDWIYFSVLLLVSAVDVERKEVLMAPVIFLYLFLPVVWFFAVEDWRTFLDRVLVGPAALFLGVWFIRFLGGAIFRKEVMGDGDPFVAALLGLRFGLVGGILSFYVGVVLGATLGVLSFLLRRKPKELPFVPFMSLGAFLYALFEPVLLNWLLLTLKGS
jgi:leader peptidase (prepilin peptidase)/N-methyltransferase